jgi:hypothetical protein
MTKSTDNYLELSRSFNKYIEERGKEETLQFMLILIFILLGNKRDNKKFTVQNLGTILIKYKPRK